MARNIAKTPVRFAWAAVLTSLTLGVTLWTASTGAQLPDTAQPGPLRARTALKTAHELYKRGDYDLAAKYYEAAQAAQTELNATERQDLAKLLQQNVVALQKRQEGSMLVKHVEDALRQNNVQEANKLIRAATTNQYLTPADRQTLAVLSDQARRGVPMANNVIKTDIVLKGEDAKSYLEAARQALEKGQYDLSEHFAGEAEKKASALTWMPWGDSPSKVRRDVARARVTTPTPVAQQPGVQPAMQPGVPGAQQTIVPATAAQPVPKVDDGKQPSPAMKSIQKFLTPPWMREKTEEPAAKPPEFPAAPNEPVTKPLPPLPSAPAKLPPTPVKSVPAAPAKSLPPGPAPITAPITTPIPSAAPAASLPALPVTETKVAEPISKEPLQISLPDYLKAPARRQDAAPKVPANDLGPVTNTPKKPVSELKLPAPPPNLKPAEARAMAIKLIQEGYVALGKKDIDTARQKALEAKSLRPDLAWSEKNPDRLLADIERQEPSGAATKTAATAAAPTSSSTDDAKQWIRQARVLLQKDQYDEAEKLCNKAANASSARWGLFEDSPDRLRADITEGRQRLNKDKAKAVMAEARALFNKGTKDDLAAARRKALEAQQLHGPYMWWEAGDRPQRLMDEIARLELGGDRKAILPEELPGSNKIQIAQDTKTGINPLAQADTQGLKTGLAPVALASSSTQTASRNRAKGLILEARDLERRGFLVEARQKAMEAEALAVTFGADEDNPRNVLLSLASRGDQRITQLLQQAAELILNNPNDPTRFQKADVNIDSARKLCESFGLDPTKINQQSQWIQQVAARSNIRPIGATNVEGSGAITADLKLPLPGVVQPPATGAKQIGLERLEHARKEIRAGNYPLARRIAEEAHNPAYGVLNEAGMVLRTIDAEEHLHQTTTAMRTFDAGLDAYLRKDHRRASKIWESVDLRLLPIEKRRQLAEIMELPEMRSGLVQASVNVPATQITQNVSRTTVTDLQEGGFKSYTAMEQIQAQQLRDRRLTVMSTAMKHVQDKQPQKAVEVLRDFLDQLKDAPVNPELVAADRRQVEGKLQQYNTLVAQAVLAEQQQKTLSGTHSETSRNLKIAKLHEQVAELMKEGRQLYKEGRYDQALAKAKTAKELDPDNITVDFFMGQIRTLKNKEEGERYETVNQERFLDAVNGDQGPSVTMKKPLHIDPYVNDRAQRRKGSESISWETKDPVEKSIYRKLEQPISLHWKDTPLATIIDDLQMLANVTVVPDVRALREASVSLEMPMSLKVENVKLKSALNILLNQAKLTFVIKDQALQITTEDYAKSRNTKLVIHPVMDLIKPVEDHKLPEVSNFNSALMRHINSTGIQYPGQMPYTPPMALPFQTSLPVGHYGNSMSSQSPGMQSTMPGAAPKPLPGQTLEDVLMSLIKNTIAQNTWEDVGGPGRIQFYPLGGGLVVNQTLEVQEEVAALLAALRRLQDLEIAIEMRLVSVSEAFFERMGVDFDINIKTPSSRFEQNLLSGQFAPFGQVNRNLGVGGVVSGLTPAGTLTPDLNVPIRNSSFDFTIPPFGGYPGTLGSDGGLSLGLAFLNDVQVFMLLEAAQGDRRTNVMQAPKITVFNGQSAFLTINDFQFFLTGVQIATPANGNQLIFTPSQQPFPLGVSMQVTPVVSADRRFVRMELFPNLTNLASTNVPLIPVQIPVPQFLDGPGSGTSANTQPQVFQMFFQQPTFTSINLNTTVRVPDGGTVLLGGLKTLSEGRNEHGPPILSKIPYLSRLFRNIAYGRKAQSLMIMVTPRIIINEEEELIHTEVLPPVPR